MLMNQRLMMLMNQLRKSCGRCVFWRAFIYAPTGTCAFGGMRKIVDASKALICPEFVTREAMRIAAWIREAEAIKKKAEAGLKKREDDDMKNMMEVF